MRRRIFKKNIKKLRNAVAHIHEQQEATKNEMDYLESVIYQIEEADVFNLEAIREELVESGYLKRSALKKGIKKQGGAKPHVFYATDGTRILVGRKQLTKRPINTSTSEEGILMASCAKYSRVSRDY